jgi:hypothetical protein
LLVAVDGDDDRPSFAVLDGVAEQVAHHAADPTGVHVDRRIAAGSDEPHVGAVLFGEVLHRADDVFGQVGEARRLELELHRAGVVAADLEQVRQQRLEPLHLGVEQLRRAGGGRVEVVALVVDHVGGQTDGGHRRAQLVRHVGDESLLHQREVGELLDLRFDAVGHGVERAAECGELVLAVHLEAHVESARGQHGAGVGGLADGGGDRTQHEPRDAADEQDQPDPHDPQGPLHEGQCLGGVRQVVRQVQLVRGDALDAQLLTDEDAGRARVGAVGKRDRLPDLLVGVGPHQPAHRRRQQLRHDGLVGAEVLGCVRHEGADPVRGDHLGRRLFAHRRECQRHHVLHLHRIALHGRVESPLGG